MNLCNIPKLKSEITINKEYLKVGMFIYYSDMANFEPFEVVSITEESMTVKDETGEEYERYFDSLQKGWRFLSEDREFIALVSPTRKESE